MNQPPVMIGARGIRDVRLKKRIALLLSLGALVTAALSGCRTAASVVEVVKEIEDRMEPANIGTVIKNTKKKSIKNSDTLLRDAIMVAGGKGKLKIRKNPPNQLLLELPATGRIENGGKEGYNG